MKTCKECHKPYITKGIIYCSVKCRKRNETRRKNAGTRKFITRKHVPKYSSDDSWLNA